MSPFASEKALYCLSWGLSLWTIVPAKLDSPLSSNFVVRRANWKGGKRKPIQRKSYPPDDKARVASEVIREKRTLSELFTQFGVYQIHQTNECRRNRASPCNAGWA